MVAWSDEKKFLTKAPKETNFTVDTDGHFPNLKAIAGDSVNAHKNLEEANAIFTKKELGQQNENNAL
ncbi:hypothetical protein ACE38V_09815 [Cytobacillus sp. Hz8]|uniref:hypothetical protein n=1 Tax=Cytobacillus sp. Hz8 TaxID=3347168 RepID=UPI0035E174B8